MIRIFKAADREFAKPEIYLAPRRAMVLKSDNEYFLEIETPIETRTPYGKTINYMPYLVQDNILLVNTPWGQQPFRIYNRQIRNNVLYCRAPHVGHDSKRYVIIDIELTDAYYDFESSMDAILTAARASNDFTYALEIDKSFQHISFKKSVLTLFDMLNDFAKEHLTYYSPSANAIRHARVDFDKWKIIFKPERESLREDIAIEDGKNLINIEIAENWDDVVMSALYTGVRGVALGAMMNFLPGGDPKGNRDIRYDRIIRLEPPAGWDTSSDIMVQQYLYNEGLGDISKRGNPKINYKVTADINVPVDIGDTIQVKHKRLGVDIEQRVISLEYDVLTQRFRKVELGTYEYQIRGFMNDYQRQLNDISIRLEKGGL